MRKLFVIKILMLFLMGTIGMCINRLEMETEKFIPLSTKMSPLTTNTWIKKNATQPPTERCDHAMDYDSESDKVILFGGFIPPRIENDETWTYDLNTDTWMNMNPPVKPSPRRFHSMAYDSQSDRTILFGGYPPNNDTWAYDFNNNIWVNMTPTTKPSMRLGHGMAYDSESDRIILFGGYAKSYDNETWAYDFNTNTWTNMNPHTKPSARYMFAMAYDSESDRIILFGGIIAGFSVSDETWAYDFNTNTWTNMNPHTKPSARASHAMVYDYRRDRIFLFGGSLNPPFDYNDETWAYDYNTNTWTNMTPSTKPHGRFAHAMAYDYKKETIILYGGFSNYPGPLNNDTWVYNAPPMPPPPPRNLKATASEKKVILSWGAPHCDGGSPITNYRVYWGTLSGGYINNVTIGNVTAYTLTGLSNWIKYFFVVSAINAVGESTKSNEVNAIPNLFIKPFPTAGWYFVSINITPTVSTISDIFASIIDRYDIIKYYDSYDVGNHWKKHNPTRPIMNDLSTINNTMGFWIHITASCTFTISGTVPSTTQIVLKKGWNMVGYPSNKPQAVSQIIAVVPEIDIIQGFNATAPYFLKTLDPNDQLSAGNGYWLHCTKDTVWTVTW